MNIRQVFDGMISEMARDDLKGAEKALMDKDWAKAAEIYVKSARKRGLEDSKIISGLGSTFRGKAGAEGVTIGKAEGGEEVTLSGDDVAAMKKAVKEYMGWEAKPKKSSSKKKKAEDEEETKPPKTELIKKKKEEPEVSEGISHKPKDEIFRNLKYADNAFRGEKKKVNKTDAVLKEALKNRELRDALLDALENKNRKQIDQLLEKDKNPED